MTEKTVIIKSALDARQVAFFVQTAGKFQSDIKIAIENKKVSAKSIMGIIALEMAEGQRANILARQRRRSSCKRIGSSIILNRNYFIYYLFYKRAFEIL